MVSGADGDVVKEWDSAVFRCDQCDNLLLWDKYDDDARMCVDCAEVSNG